MSKECESVVELDRRIELLLDEIKGLRASIEEESNFVGGVCNQLVGSQKSLDTTSEIFDVIVRLIKLNKLCKRIDKSPIFRIQDSTCLTTPMATQQPHQSSATSSDVMVNDNDNGTDMARQSKLEMIETFESTYAPLENILSQRPDLPYANYANLVRTMKLSLSA